MAKKTKLDELRLRLSRESSTQSPPKALPKTEPNPSLTTEVIKVKPKPEKKAKADEKTDEKKPVGKKSDAEKKPAEVEVPTHGLLGEMLSDFGF